MSSTLPGNPHYKAACYDELNSEARALQATLALAYEQHTANLIALLQPIKTDGSGEIVPEEPFALEILKQISERLGVE